MNASSLENPFRPAPSLDKKVGSATGSLLGPIGTRYADQLRSRAGSVRALHERDDLDQDVEQPTLLDRTERERMEQRKSAQRLLEMAESSLDVLDEGTTWWRESNFVIIDGRQEMGQDISLLLDHAIQVADKHSAEFAEAMTSDLLDRIRFLSPKQVDSVFELVEGLSDRQNIGCRSKRQLSAMVIGRRPTEILQLKDVSGFSSPAHLLGKAALAQVEIAYRTRQDTQAWLQLARNKYVGSGGGKREIAMTLRKIGWYDSALQEMEDDSNQQAKISYTQQVINDVHLPLIARQEALRVFWKLHGRHQSYFGAQGYLDYAEIAASVAEIDPEHLLNLEDFKSWIVVESGPKQSQMVATMALIQEEYGNTGLGKSYLAQAKDLLGEPHLDISEDTIRSWMMFVCAAARQGEDVSELLPHIYAALQYLDTNNLADSAFFLEQVSRFIPQHLVDVAMHVMNKEVDGSRTVFHIHQLMNGAVRLHKKSASPVT